MYYFLTYALISGIIFTGVLIRSVFKNQIYVTLLDLFGSSIMGLTMGWLILPIYLIFQLDKIHIK